MTDKNRITVIMQCLYGNRNIMTIDKDDLDM